MNLHTINLQRTSPEAHRLVLVIGSGLCELLKLLARENLPDSRHQPHSDQRRLLSGLLEDAAISREKD